MSDAGQRLDARAARDGGVEDTLSARLPATLCEDLDALVDAEATRYEHRSEAIRDLLRRGLAAHPESSRPADGGETE